MATELSDTRPPGRIDFSTTDADVAADYCQGVYRTHMRFSGMRDGLTYTHSRLDTGLFAVDKLQLPQHMDVALEPFHALIVINMYAGRFGRECAGIDECFMGGDVFITADPSLPAHFRISDIHYETTTVDLSVLAQVATAPTRAPGPIRFTGFQPISRRAAATWKSTTAYLAELLADTAAAQPLIRGSAARLLAATALTTFPNTALVEPTSQDRCDATSATVRRATAFIEQHPDRDLSVADIAAATHVSIRAVQEAFRRQLDTTPHHTTPHHTHAVPARRPAGPRPPRTTRRRPHQRRHRHRHRHPQGLLQPQPLRRPLPARLRGHPRRHPAQRVTGDVRR